MKTNCIRNERIEWNERIWRTDDIILIKIVTDHTPKVTRNPDWSQKEGLKDRYQLLKKNKKNTNTGDREQT